MYRKDSESWLKHIDFILLDMICLQLAYILAYGISGYGFNPYAKLLYRGMAVYLELADLVVVFAYGTMKNALKRGHYRNFIITINHAITVGALAILYLFMTQQGAMFSRLTLILTIPIYAIITYTVRELWKANLKRRVKSGDGAKLLVICSNDVAEQTILNIQKNNFTPYSIVGAVMLDSDMTGNKICGVPIVTNAENVPMYVCTEWVDEILVVTSDEAAYPKKLLDELVETGVTVHFNIAKCSNISGEKQFVENVAGYTVLTTSINYASSMELLVKRLIDIAGGLVGCIATGILLVFVAPAIYIASPGPIFFSQERVGRNGKKFNMYKFRSMYIDAEQRKAELMKDNKISDGKMFKLDFDPRVIGNKVLPDGTKKTGVGDFLRRTSLDEFPQFFNVLKGDMSIVGTRPPLVSETSLYEPHHRARLAIKPGITGMWQVSGRSDITDFEEVVRLDREYITNWNIGLDIKILLKTISVVFKKDGSA